MKILHTILRPFALEATMKCHGWFQLTPFYWHESPKTLYWATQFGREEPVLLKIREIPSANPAPCTIELEWDGDKNHQDTVIKKVRHVFNLDIDLTGFYHLAKRHRYLDQIESRGIGRLMRSESLFEDLFKAICGTNVTWRQAVKMINAIGALGPPVPGTEYHVFPNPQAILEAGEAFLKQVGRVGYRSAYLVELCHRFLESPPLAQQIERGVVPAAEMKKFFLGIKGIGKVTAHYLSALYGDFSELAIDSLVLSYMTKQHFSGVKPTHQQIEDFYAPFGEWRYLAYWMEFIVAEGWKPEV